jgi:hypothetical protein
MTKLRLVAPPSSDTESRLRLAVSTGDLAEDAEPDVVYYRHMNSWMNPTMTKGQLDKLASIYVGLTVASYSSTIVPAITLTGTETLAGVISGALLGSLFWGLALLVSIDL